MHCLPSFLERMLHTPASFIPLITPQAHPDPLTFVFHRDRLLLRSEDLLISGTDGSRVSDSDWFRSMFGSPRGSFGGVGSELPPTSVAPISGNSKKTRAQRLGRGRSMCFR